MPRAGHPVDLAHEDRHPGHRRLVNGVERAGAAADRAGALGLGADHEAGLVDEVHDGQVELVAEVDEAGELLGGVRGQPAAVVLRIGGEHADGPARQPREAGHERAAVVAAELEHRAGIEHELEDPAGFVRAPAVARNDREELLLAPVRRVRGLDERRRLPGVLGEIGEEALQLSEGVVLVLGDVVHRADTRLHAGPAELLLVGRLAHRRRDHRRAGDEQLGAALDDHGEVRADDPRRAKARHRAERRGDDRHDRLVLHDELEAG